MKRLAMLGLLVMACSSGPKTDPYWRACFDRSGLKELGDKLPGNEIYAFKYKGQVVFLVGGCDNCSDSMGQLYTCDGQVICLFGGIAGLNTCPDFNDTATDQVLIWKRN